MESLPGSDIEIRRMTPKDCGEAARFCGMTTRWMWEKYLKGSYPKEASEFDIRERSAANLRQMLKDQDAFGIVAVSGGKICGIVLGTVHGRSGYGFLKWIAVDPGHQHEGIGVRLMTAAEEHLKGRGCHKIASNTMPELIPAVRLNLKFGMMPEAFLREQWWGADFIVMSKWLGRYKRR